jgi:hypothetical protein
MTGFCGDRVKAALKALLAAIGKFKSATKQFLVDQSAVDGQTVGALHFAAAPPPRPHPGHILAIPD